ncbi:hypothetical protein OPIT5_10885 [Opitutaceae bacterium TAV5]|nr:hypothetical protein OPIT5_10885 [Opitutaceae bacterium TAV5]
MQRLQSGAQLRELFFQRGDLRGAGGGGFTGGFGIGGDLRALGPLARLFFLLLLLFLGLAFRGAASRKNAYPKTPVLN